MKSKLLITSVALSICASFQTSVAAPSPTALFGDPAPLSAAERTIVIGPNTKWVNVTGGETIRFVAGQKSFAWSFDTASTISSFDLNQVAPPGALDHKVTAYIAPDPRYIGGDGRDGR